MKYLILLLVLGACATPIYRAPEGECNCKCRVKEPVAEFYKPTPGETRNQ